jgi:beta-galactosidase
VLPPLAFKRGRTRARPSGAAASSPATRRHLPRHVGWGQGIVWINGRCLGRYWSIGPTQTMYLPGPWIRRGRNEVVVLDLTGPREARIAGLKTPILDQLHPERDLARPPSTVRPQLDGVKPVHEGEFAPGAARQDVRFAAPARGPPVLPGVARRLRRQAVRRRGRDWRCWTRTARRSNQSAWTIAYASSEEATKEDGSALNAINGQASDHWHTALQRQGGQGGHPHRLIIDLGKGGGGRHALHAAPGRRRRDRPHQALPRLRRRTAGQAKNKEERDMQRRHFIGTLMAGGALGAAAPALSAPAPNEDRAYMAGLLQKMAEPVLSNMARAN